MPVIRIAHEKERDFLRLTIGIVNDVLRNNCPRGIRAHPAKAVKEMQLSGSTEELYSTDRARVRMLESRAFGVAALKVDDPANIEAYSVHCLNARGKLREVLCALG